MAYGSYAGIHGVRSADLSAEVNASAIVTADDFGASQAVNRAVEDCLRKGFAPRAARPTPGEVFKGYGRRRDPTDVICCREAGVSVLAM
jgi:hypothetical protein